jgi:hypothetical protein
MYLHKAHEDNRTRTAVSVAMDLRDALTFRKPKPAFQGADTVTIYVVYAPRVLDTSSVAFDLWNAERWERGEVAAYEVPTEHHLGQIDVERFYDPANGNYVVGRIVGHRTLTATVNASTGPLTAAITTLAAVAPPAGGARQAVKNQLHAMVVALQPLINDRGVPGITRTLYPLYAELQQCDGTPATGVTLAIALQAQVAINNLLLPLDAAGRYINGRLDAWQQQHDNLLMNGGLRTLPEWEAFVADQVMKDTGP